MEAKSSKAELTILKKPKGEVTTYASFDHALWEVDEDGRSFVKWGEEKWIPSIIDQNSNEKKEEKK